MRQIKIFTYSPDLVLSNKYLEAILQCLEPKILDEKVEVSFSKIKKNRIKPQLSHLISWVLDIV